MVAESPCRTDTLVTYTSRVRMWGSDAHVVSLGLDGLARRDVHACGNRVLIRFELAQITVVTPFESSDGAHILYQVYHGSIRCSIR